MFYHFYADFDCIVKIENANFKVTAGTGTICQTDDKIDYAEVVPLDHYELLPYCFSFDNILNKTDSGGLVYAIKINASNVIINLCSNYPKVYSVLASLSTLSADYEVSSDVCVKLSCGQKVICSKNIDCTSAELYQKNNLIFCVLSAHNYKILLVLDEQNNILVDDKITQIEHLSNGFQTLLDFKDMQKQGLVKKYEIVDGVVQKTGEYAVYINHSAKEIYSQKFVPLAFFEAVRANNFSLAKTYLSSSLINIITPAHIKAYFGEFNTIFDVSDINNFPSICLYSSKAHSHSTYKLLILANKIENIEKI